MTGEERHSGRKINTFFPLLFKQEHLHFCFALGPKNYIASPEYINRLVFIFKEIINFH